MKVINSQEVKTVTQIKSDSEIRKYCYLATIYDEQCFIDTKTGEGYDKVIKRMEPLICKLAAKYWLNSYSTFEDAKQDVIVYMLECLPKYNNNLNVKLSSFIQMSVNRKLINKIRNNSRKIRNATILNIGTYNITCECGHNFMAVLDNNEKSICPSCGSMEDANTTKYNIPMIEISESMLFNVDNVNCNEFYDNTNISVYNDVVKNVENYIINKYDIENWLNKENPKIVKIVKLIYEGHSVKTAAEKVGLSSMSINVKLKNLKRKKRIREIFGR